MTASSKRQSSSPDGVLTSAVERASSPKRAKTESNGEQSTDYNLRSSVKENQSPQQRAKSPQRDSLTAEAAEVVRSPKQQKASAAESKSAEDDNQQKNAKSLKSPKSESSKQINGDASPKQSASASATAKKDQVQESSKSPKQSSAASVASPKKKKSEEKEQAAGQEADSKQSKSESSKSPHLGPAKSLQKSEKSEKSEKTVNGSPSHQSGKSDLSDFQKRVFEAVHSVPKGKVATYHDIAVMISQEGASYQVGNALHHCPDHSVPVHRITTAHGEIKANAGECSSQAHENIEKLKAEGLKIEGDKVVDFEKHRYHAQK